LLRRAPGNVKDASNQRFVRFQYGLPSGNEIIGLTASIQDLRGLNVRAEFDLNRRSRRFPNQNYRVDQALARDQSLAFYITASQVSYPWFVYGEVFNIDPDYSTSMFIPDQRGFIDYENEGNNLYEFVDDNDDQDEFPDWRRRAVWAATDIEVFPGYDENNDLIPDINQNMNLQPDYEEPFLRYGVDPPEFLFGMDMNNNTFIDRFENDNEPDYPYKRDHRGYNVYVGANLVPDVKLTVGHTGEKLISSARRSRAAYALLTARRDFPKWKLEARAMDMAKSVRDDIRDDVILWEQPPMSTGTMQESTDPLIARDTFVNSAYLELHYAGLHGMRFTTKFKHNLYHQRGSQAEGKRDRTFLGAIGKADYEMRLSKDMVLSPKWKTMYKREIPTDPQKMKTHEISHMFFFLGRYSILKQTWIELGWEHTLFSNLVAKPEVLPPGYVEDFQRTVLATQFSNTSAYLGYQLAAKLGFRWEKTWFEERKSTNSVAFIEIYAGAQD